MSNLAERFITAFERFVECGCMPEFPMPVGGSVVRSHGAAPGVATLSLSLQAGGSPNSKGDFEEIVAATEFDANWIEIDLTSLGGTNTTGLVDIAIGEEDDEVVVIPNIFVATRSGTGSFGSYLFPLFIPKGSRLSARYQCTTANFTCGISIRLISGTVLSAHPTGKVSEYGDTGDSLGTLIDPGEASNTDSAWVEIEGSTERNHSWLVVAGKFGDGSLSFGTAWRVQIGIGPAASEQVLIGDLHYSADTLSDTPGSQVRAFPVAIPKGSRIVAKARCVWSTANDRNVWLKVYGA